MCSVKWMDVQSELHDMAKDVTGNQFRDNILEQHNYYRGSDKGEITILVLGLLH